MLIQAITQAHKEEIEQMEAKYQARFEEQANNEKVMKQSLETLQKYSETLERERMNERQMRLKLEEEYTQNTKNHEEEVQLRLKFEAKLNGMHSKHRELNTKYERAIKDLETVTDIKEKQDVQIEALSADVTDLQKDIVAKVSIISHQKEKQQGLQREIDIKAQQMLDLEKKVESITDERDLATYKLQEQQKDLTELKLKSEVLASTNNALVSEKQHLVMELKQTRELYKTYELKCSELMAELHNVTQDFQELKRNMIQHDEHLKQRDDKIGDLKSKLEDLEVEHETLLLNHNTLKVQYQKEKELLEKARAELADTVKKLHITNKVRHETEIKLGEVHEKMKDQNMVLSMKEEILDRK